MYRGVSIALIIIGVVLIFWGISSSESFSSEVSRFFTGSPTEKTMWLMIGGIACAAIGLFGVFRGSGGK